MLESWVAPALGVFFGVVIAAAYWIGYVRGFTRAKEGYSS